jgi:hypothetical protein
LRLASLLVYVFTGDSDQLMMFRMWIESSYDQPAIAERALSVQFFMAANLTFTGAIQSVDFLPTKLA